MGAVNLPSHSNPNSSVLMKSLYRKRFLLMVQMHKHTITSTIKKNKLSTRVDSPPAPPTWQH